MKWNFSAASSTHSSTVTISVRLSGIITRQRELADFLRQRRAQIGPAEAGLPTAEDQRLILYTPVP